MLNAQSIADANETDHEATRMGLDSSKRFSPQAQAASAANRVTRAITRRCWPDLMTAWPALLEVCGVTLTPLDVDLQGRADWGKVIVAVDIALENADTPASCIHWRHADMAIRGLAAQAAKALTEAARREQGRDHWDDVDTERRESITDAHCKAARFTAFAKAVA